MALTFTTWESGFTNCPVGWASWGATGSNIVSVGIQTQGNQQNFAVVQCFVTGTGTGCYVQVANNGFSNTIKYQFIIVQAFDDDVSAANAVRPTLTEAVVEAKTA